MCKCGNSILISVQMVDSKGGKIQVPSAGGEGNKEQKGKEIYRIYTLFKILISPSYLSSVSVASSESSTGGDFLKGVLGVVTDVAGKLQEGAAHGQQAAGEAGALRSHLTRVVNL